MRFQPVHIAVTVQAADDPAWETVRRLRKSGFRGRISLVGAVPQAEARSLDGIDPAPDLAFLSGGEKEVARALRDAKRAGVRQVVITSRLEPDSRERLAPYAARMQIVGPASEGVADLATLFNVTPLGAIQRPGSAGLLSLGPHGLSTADHPSHGRGGYGRIVSLGEGWFSSVPELLREWSEDASLGVLGVLLDPSQPVGELLDPLREAAGRKPLVLLWSGEGAEALARHTGAAVATTPMEFHGLVRALELFNIWDGERLALVGSDAPSLQLARRLLEAEGLRVGPLSPEVVGLLYRLGALERVNPVLLPPESTPADLARTAEVLVGDELVDAVICVASKHADGDLASLAGLLAELGARSAKPVGLLTAGGLGHDEVLAYEDPAELARQLRKLSLQGQRRFKRHRERPRHFTTPDDFSLESFGLKPEQRYQSTGPRIETWRDPSWGPVVRLESRDATAVLPANYHEAEEWLREIGLEETDPVAELLIQLRDCYDSCPELSRVELEATSEPGVIALGGLKVEFS